jgi:hypothetical protein
LFNSRAGARRSAAVRLLGCRSGSLVTLLLLEGVGLL